MKWIGQHIWDFISRFRNKVYFENLEGGSSTTALVVDSEGRVFTNTLSAGGGGSNGEASLVRLEVRYGEAVVKGDPVYVSGFHGSSGPVIMSKADSGNAAKMPAFGLADANYAKNATGYAISLGNLVDLDTSSYSVGDTLYVASGGGLTSTKPSTQAKLIQNVGTVSRSNASNGQVEVTATGRSNDVPNLNDGYIFIGNASNQPETTSLSSLLPPDLTVSGTGTIDANNVPTLNQDTTGNSATATALTSGDKTISGDLTVTGNDIKDSGGNSIISSDGSGVITMAGGNIGFGTSGGSDNSNFNINSGCDIVLGADVAGGTSSTIMYLDSGSTGRYMLMAEATDKVVLCNRAANGTVQIRANTSTPGGGGEVTVATFEDDKVTISQDLDVAGNVLPGITAIKILPSDFIADDGGRPLAIDDNSSGTRFLESYGTNPMFASVEIPAGFKATRVDIYGYGTSVVTVYEADINSRNVTSKGIGNIGTQINITDVTSNATNYLLIQLTQTSGGQVNGGTVTIEKA